jgi:hypothetical protein
MICSVYDPHRRCYDYYEVPGTSKDYGARGTKYRPPTQGPQGSKLGAIGFAPEALALPLPQPAQHVGSGDLAKGIICTLPGGGAMQKANLGSMPVDVTDRSLTGTQSMYALSGLGETTIIEKEKPHSWEHVIGAAVVAGVVGVVVQKLLKAK